MTDALTLFVAAMPPPLHGQSFVNARILSKLESSRDARLITFDIGPGNAKSRMAYHWNRAWRVTQAVLGLAKAGLCGHSSRPAVYSVFDSGFGRVYNCAIFIVARFLGMRLVLHHHTAKQTREPDWLFKLLLRICGPAAVHVALSQQMQSDLARAGVRNCLVLNNSIFIDPDTRSMSARTSVGIFSNLTIEKGVLTALAAYEWYRSRGGKAGLVIAGPFSDSVVGSAIDAAVRKYPGEVEYRGALDERGKAEFFADVRTLLFPSAYKFEAQPVVLLEALNCGVKCLVRNVGYVAELIGRADWTCPISEKFEDWASNGLLSDESVDSGANEAWARARFDALRQHAARAETQLLDLLAPNR